MPTGLTHGKAGKAESTANIWVSEPWKSGAIYKNGKLEKESCFESRYTYSKISQSVESLFGYANEQGCISNVGLQGATLISTFYWMQIECQALCKAICTHYHLILATALWGHYDPVFSWGTESWRVEGLFKLRLEETLGHWLRSCKQWEGDGLGLEPKSVQFQISVAWWHCAVSFRRM